MLNIAHVPVTAVAVNSNTTEAPVTQATQNNTGKGSDIADQPKLTTQAQLSGSTSILLAMSVLTNAILLTRAATEPSPISPCTVSQKDPDPAMCVHGN